jgi:hypothetical protein
MLTRQEEEAEREAVLENDRLVREQQKQREQSGTFFSHAQAQAAELAQGRFAGVNSASVIGSTEATRYPAASLAHQTELPPEPSLGFSIDEMPGLEPSMATPCSSSIEETGDPAYAPSGDSLVQQPSGGLMSERAGSSPSQKDQDNG